MRKLAQILFRKHQLEHQKLSIPWIPSCRGPGLTLLGMLHRAPWPKIRIGKDEGCGCCPEWRGGSPARRILKETNRCSLLEFCPDELPYTEHDLPPLIPHKFSLTKYYFWTKFDNNVNKLGENQAKNGYMIHSLAASGLSGAPANSKKK
jgi:hypothetical protein